MALQQNQAIKYQFLTNIEIIVALINDISAMMTIDETYWLVESMNDAMSWLFDYTWAMSDNINRPEDEQQNYKYGNDALIPKYGHVHWAMLII